MNVPVVAISNGIDLSKYCQSPEKEQAFKNHFQVLPDQKIVMCAALYFKRKGIDDFVKVAEMMPDVRFIWFGETNLWTVPGWVRRLVKKNHPTNVEFPGYIKGDIYEGAMTASDVFFFPSHEETEGIVVLEALASHQKVLVRVGLVAYRDVGDDYVTRITPLSSDLDAVYSKLMNFRAEGGGDVDPIFDEQGLVVGQPVGGIVENFSFHECSLGSQGRETELPPSAL